MTTSHCHIPPRSRSRMTSSVAPIVMGPGIGCATVIIYKHHHIPSYQLNILRFRWQLKSNRCHFSLNFQWNYDEYKVTKYCQWFCNFRNICVIFPFITLSVQVLFITFLFLIKILNIYQILDCVSWQKLLLWQIKVYDCSPKLIYIFCSNPHM